MNIICPRCNRSRVTYEKVEVDKTTKKNWKITSCVSCDYHFNLEEYNEPRNPNKGWFKPAR